MDYALVLFPHSPEPVTDHVFETYFRPTLDHVFKLLCNSPRPTTLEIALPWHTTSLKEKPQLQLFARNAKLIDGVLGQANASLASFASSTCRYRLILYSRQEAEAAEPQAALRVTLRSLVYGGRPWTRIFTVESPGGEELRDEFKALGEYLGHSEDTFERVPGGIHIIVASHIQSYHEGLKQEGTRAHASNVAVFIGHEASGLASLVYLMASALDAGQHPDSSAPANLIVGSEDDAITTITLDSVRSVLESPQSGQRQTNQALADLGPGWAASLTLDSGARCLLQQKSSESFSHFVDCLPRPCLVMVPEDKAEAYLPVLKQKRMDYLRIA